MAEPNGLGGGFADVAGRLLPLFMGSPLWTRVCGRIAAIRLVAREAVGLLIRRSEVRTLVGEPIKSRGCVPHNPLIFLCARPVAQIWHTRRPKFSTNSNNSRRFTLREIVKPDRPLAPDLVRPPHLRLNNLRPRFHACALARTRVYARAIFARASRQQNCKGPSPISARRTRGHHG